MSSFVFLIERLFNITKAEEGKSNYCSELPKFVVSEKRLGVNDTGWGE